MPNTICGMKESVYAHTSQTPCVASNVSNLDTPNNSVHVVLYEGKTGQPIKCIHSVANSVLFFIFGWEWHPRTLCRGKAFCFIEARKLLQETKPMTLNHSYASALCCSWGLDATPQAAAIPTRSNNTQHPIPFLHRLRYPPRLMIWVHLCCAWYKGMSISVTSACHGYPKIIFLFPVVLRDPENAILSDNSSWLYRVPIWYFGWL
jgi:hypothetical protein